jgi:cytidylate kinase
MIAIAGERGTGKTTISGTLARQVHELLASRWYARACARGR